MVRIARATVTRRSGETRMSSFSCPHYIDLDAMCRRVGDDCVPGRPGCVLQNDSVFSVSVEERLRQKALEKVMRSGDPHTVS
jgi:hypothetical protein